MNNEVQCAAGELNGVAVVSMGRDCYMEPPSPRVLSTEGVHLSRFDDAQARQARFELIQASILFFGLDNECLSL